MLKSIVKLGKKLNAQIALHTHHKLLDNLQSTLEAETRYADLFQQMLPNNPKMDDIIKTSQHECLDSI